MLRRGCSNLRPLAASTAAAYRSIPKPQNLTCRTITGRRLIHIPPNSALVPQIFRRPFVTPNFSPPFGALTAPQNSCSPLHLMQVRHITAKQRERKLKSRKPMTPVTSKVKKYKMKFYSSFKGRFRVMQDGQIRRWKAGKRHNAHSKSRKSKQRLRQPGLVHLAYAKVMKKLSFCA